MLLHVLDDLKTTQKKGFVTGCIHQWSLFSYVDDDWTPYPSVKEQGGDEPRWQRLVAFARMDCVQNKWMDEKGRDQWKISILGKQIIQKAKSRFAEGTLDVRNCYLWTPKFKKLIVSSYTPAGSDTKRPAGGIYEDTKFSAFLDEYIL